MDHAPANHQIELAGHERDAQQVAEYRGTWTKARRTKRRRKVDPEGGWSPLLDLVQESSMSVANLKYFL
jgi:hypothetical protein